MLCCAAAADMIIISDDEEAVVRLAQVEEDEALARSLQVGGCSPAGGGVWGRNVSVFMILSTHSGPV